MPDILNHDQAISAICDCSRTTTVLSYQEAIEGYFKLRGLPVPPAPQSEEEIDAECERISAMTPEELDAHIRAQGDDPAEVVRRFDRLTKNAVEIVRLRGVARAAKVLSMLWTSSIDPMGQEFLGAVNDAHLAVCELYGVDPVKGFRMKTNL